MLSIIRKKLLLALLFGQRYHGCMSENETRKNPFKLLGSTLRKAREIRKQSLAEVSGAVEIDTDALLRFESGEQRPTEDILLLLISHFDLKDEEATKLWELAGYGEDKTPGATQTSSFDLGQPVAMVMPMDLRVVYTDMVHVMVNNYGVVMNFMQGAGPNGQPLAVARIGMSKDHAKSVLQVLSDSLKAADSQKALPETTQQHQSVDKSKES